MLWIALFLAFAIPWTLFCWRREIAKAIQKNREEVEPIPELVVKLLEIGEGWTQEKVIYDRLNHPSGATVVYEGVEMIGLFVGLKNVEPNGASRAAINKALVAYLEGKHQAEMNEAIVAFADRIQQRYGEGRC